MSCVWIICAELCYRALCDGCPEISPDWRARGFPRMDADPLTAICYCPFLATLVGSPKICSAMSHSDFLSLSLALTIQYLLHSFLSHTHTHCEPPPPPFFTLSHLSPSLPLSSRSSSYFTNTTKRTRKSEMEAEDSTAKKM